MTPVTSPTTRCPHCRTVFRVTAAQLQAHGGQVRCGRCLQVFDALAAITPEPGISETVAPARATDENQAPVQAEYSLQAAQGADPTQADAPAPDNAAGTPEAVAAAPATAASLPDARLSDHAEAAAGEEAPMESPLPPALDDAAADAATGSAWPDTAFTEPKSDADNPFVQSPAVVPPRAPSRRRLLAAGSGLLLAGLIGQGLFFYRDEIAARHPLARQWLTAVCAAGGCTVKLPQRPQSIQIEASDLQVVDPANPNRIQLTATLRNHAGYDVGFPALDLVLTNVNDHTLARRIFMPAEYVAAGRDLQAGIAAHAELTVRLALDTGNLGAAGFRLAVLAVPPR
jgi:predicted Zn finger-like uncharacterized protein